MIQLKFNNKCANSPFNPAINLSDYKCYNWIYNNGYFNEYGCVIDYIDEYIISHNNSINNIQLLCPNCYTVKLNRFNKQKQHFTSSQLANGMCYMDIS
jgi:hypothetical protein